MREHRFFRGEGEPLPFLLESIIESGETIWRIRMESSTYWLDLIAETYIGICVLCCLFIISQTAAAPCPYDARHAAGLAHHHAVGRPLGYLGL